MISGLLITLFYFLLMLYGIGKLRFFSFEMISRKTVLVFFVYKIAAGIALSLVYSYFYADRTTADTFKYFDDSRVIFNLLSENKSLFMQFMFGTSSPDENYLHYANLMNTWWNKFSIYNDARTTIRLNVLLRFVSFGHYPVHLMFFNFISFTGLVALAKMLLNHLQSLRREFLYLLFLFPSIAFWGSGVMKDGLIFFSLGFSLYFLDRLLCSTGSFKWKFAVCFFLFLGFLFFTKLHIFIVLIPCMMAYCLAKSQKKFRLIYYALVPVFFLTTLFIPPLISEQLDVAGYLTGKQHENIRVAEEMNAGSRIDIKAFDGSAFSILAACPQGFINTLLRPHIFEANNLLAMLAAVENLFMVMFFALMCLAFRKDLLTKSNSLLFALCFVMTLFTVIGIMTPVLGALVRYKIQGLPFLFFIFCKLTDKTLLLNKIPVMRHLIRTE